MVKKKPVKESILDKAISKAAEDEDEAMLAFLLSLSGEITEKQLSSWVRGYVVGAATITCGFALGYVFTRVKGV